MIPAAKFSDSKGQKLQRFSVPRNEPFTGESFVLIRAFKNTWSVLCFTFKKIDLKGQALLHPFQKMLGLFSNLFVILWTLCTNYAFKLGRKYLSCMREEYNCSILQVDSDQYKVIKCILCAILYLLTIDTGAV